MTHENAQTIDLTITMLSVRTNILKTAEAARAAGQSADFFPSIKTLYVVGPNGEHLFKDKEAIELMTAAEQCAKLLNINDVSDVILHDAQSW